MGVYPENHSRQGYSPGMETARKRVAVIMQRRALQSRWQSETWEPVGVLPDGLEHAFVFFQFGVGQSRLRRIFELGQIKIRKLKKVPEIVVFAAHYQFRIRNAGFFFQHVE